MTFELTTLVMISTKLPNYQVGVDDKLKYKTVHYQIWLFLEDSNFPFADVISQMYSAEY